MFGIHSTPHSTGIEYIGMFCGLSSTFPGLNHWATVYKICGQNMSLFDYQYTLALSWSCKYIKPKQSPVSTDLKELIAPERFRTGDMTLFGLGFEESFWENE